MLASRESLSPEARLLLLTAAPSPSDSALRQAMSENIDWADLCALADHEKASAVVFRRLSSVAPVANENLRDLATVSVMRMLQLEQLLHRTLDVLARAKIDVVLLKGAGLAYTAYASFVDRPMGDLDLLVRPEDSATAWSMLQTQGWEVADPELKSERFAGHQHLPRLCQASGAFRLEIHRALLPEEHRFQFSTEMLWSRTRRVTVNGRVFTVPHQLHQLWHVCVHFVWSHAMQWGSWRTLRDTAAIIRGGGIDWAEFVRFARETRAATCCFWTLRLARRFARADVPDHVLESLRPPSPDFIVELLEQHFIAGLFPSADGCPSYWLSRRLWEAGVSPRWSRHGASRPWQVDRRWGPAAAASTIEQPLGRSVTHKLGKFGAASAYLLGLLARHQK